MRRSTSPPCSSRSMPYVGVSSDPVTVSSTYVPVISCGSRMPSEPQEATAKTVTARQNVITPFFMALPREKASESSLPRKRSKVEEHDGRRDGRRNAHNAVAHHLQPPPLPATLRAGRT